MRADVATKARPGPFDALEKAREDELIFTLLGRDPDAPETILAWAGRRRARAATMADGDARRAELQQCTEAELIAFEMQARQRGEAAGAAGFAPRVQLGGTNPHAERDARLTRLRGLLSEADFNANEAIELCFAPETANPLTGEQMDRLRAAQGAIHELVLALSPHRHAAMEKKEDD